MAKRITIPPIAQREIELSPKLAQVAELLIASGDQGITARELSLATETTTVHSYLSALKRMGMIIEAVVDDTSNSQKGSKRYFYRGWI